MFIEMSLKKLIEELKALGKFFNIDINKKTWQLWILESKTLENKGWTDVNNRLDRNLQNIKELNQIIRSYINGVIDIVDEEISSIFISASMISEAISSMSEKYDDIIYKVRWYTSYNTNPASSLHLQLF